MACVDINVVEFEGELIGMYNTKNGNLYTLDELFMPVEILLMQGATKVSLEEVVCQATISENAARRLLPYVQSINAKAMLQRNVLTGYHMTSGSSSASIIRHEFRCSAQGGLGPGIYFTTRPEDVWGKAQHHGPILEVEVDIGRCKRVTDWAPSTSLQSLRAEGYDSIWKVAPADKQEFCVFEPHRITFKRAIMSDLPQDNIKMFGALTGDSSGLEDLLAVACDVPGCRGMIIGSASGGLVCGSCGDVPTIEKSMVRHMNAGRHP